MRVLIASAFLVGCGRGGAGAPGEVALELDTAPGLSGLATASDGALWAVAERARAAYRIVLAGDRVASLETIPIEGIPAELDLESIETRDGRRFWIGTEGNGTSAAEVWTAERDGDAIVVRGGPRAIDPASHVIAPNHGVEGVCGTAHAGAVALETAIEDGDRRLAQVDLVRDGVSTPQRVVMTSATGKIAAIDCTIEDGGVEVLAIERHFEVTRLIAFTLRGETAPVEARVVRDLGAMAKGRNFEGLARLADGRIAMVTDNQWKTIEGPSQLVILPEP